LNGLPLAILLGKSIVSFSKFIADYRAYYCFLMDKYSPRGLLSDDKERSIMTVFSMLYSFIKNWNPEAAALLALYRNTWPVADSYVLYETVPA
jgi:hypothetical protein